MDGIRLQSFHRSLPQTANSRSPQIHERWWLSHTTKSRFCVAKNVPVLRSDHSPFETIVFGMRPIAQESSPAKKRYTRMIVTLSLGEAWRTGNRSTVSVKTATPWLIRDRVPRDWGLLAPSLDTQGNYACAATFVAPRLSARSSSALNAWPQVLHLHFAFGLITGPSPVFDRLFSLGRNAITNSPPQPKHRRFSIVPWYYKDMGRTVHKRTLWWKDLCRTTDEKRRIKQKSVQNRTLSPKDDALSSEKGVPTQELQPGENLRDVILDSTPRAPPFMCGFRTGSDRPALGCTRHSIADYWRIGLSSDPKKPGTGESPGCVPRAPNLSPWVPWIPGFQKRWNGCGC